MDADFSFMAVNIQQNLRRFADPGHGFERVAASQNGEIRDRIEFKQIGAGDDEEVADHQVRRPGQEQIGQAVKNVKDITAFIANDVVYLGGKRFKSGIGVQLIDFDSGTRLQKGGVVGKTHIDQTLIPGQGFLNIGGDEFFVILNIVNLQDDIVAHLQVIENFIQAVDAGADSCIRGHKTLFPLLRFQ